jgi:hypothetical protein
MFLMVLSICRLTRLTPDGNLITIADHFQPSKVPGLTPHPHPSPSSENSGSNEFDSTISQNIVAEAGSKRYRDNNDSDPELTQPPRKIARVLPFKPSDPTSTFINNIPAQNISTQDPYHELLTLLHQPQVSNPVKFPVSTLLATLNTAPSANATLFVPHGKHLGHALCCRKVV